MLSAWEAERRGYQKDGFYPSSASQTVVFVNFRCNPFIPTDLEGNYHDQEPVFRIRN
jgi:hypothetical protein